MSMCVCIAIFAQVIEHVLDLLLGMSRDTAHFWGRSAVAAYRGEREPNPYAREI